MDIQKAWFTIDLGLWIVSAVRMLAEDYYVNMDGPPLPGGVPYRDMVKAEVSAIPSLFGRLTYVAALRDPESGYYRHPATAGVFDPHVVDAVLRCEHLEIFEAWLCLSLEEQAADLAAYLWKHIENRSEALGDWMRQFPCVKLIPSAAWKAQRELFRSDLEMVFNILYHRDP